MTDQILVAYYASALIGALLVIHVMQKTEHDRINKVAPSWLQWVRRGSFVLMALLLCNTVMREASRLSLMMVVWSGIGAIVINAVALHLRVPPDNRSGRPIVIVRKWAWFSRVIASFRDSVLHK